MKSKQIAYNKNSCCLLSKLCICDKPRTNIGVEMESQSSGQFTPYFLLFYSFGTFFLIREKWLLKVNIFFPFERMPHQGGSMSSINSCPLLHVSAMCAKQYTCLLSLASALLRASTIECEQDSGDGPSGLKSLALYFRVMKVNYLTNLFSFLSPMNSEL